MVWREDRPRPSADYLPASGPSARRGRHVLLRTGRGDVRLSADEAEALADELRAMAALVRFKEREREAC